MSKHKPATHNPENGSSHMDIVPLDPRQGEPIDTTIPHALDSIFPDPRPTVQQPTISPLSIPDTGEQFMFPRVAPGDYKTGSKGGTTT